MDIGYTKENVCTGVAKMCKYWEESVILVFISRVTKQQGK